MRAIFSQLDYLLYRYFRKGEGKRLKWNDEGSHLPEALPTKTYEEVDDFVEFKLMT